MKKIFIVLSFLIFSSSAIAADHRKPSDNDLVTDGPGGKWTSINFYGDDKNRYEQGVMAYVDKSSIKKKGDRVHIAALFSYANSRTVNGKTFRSSKSIHEYDCKSQVINTISAAMYAGDYGTGKNLGAVPKPFSRNYSVWALHEKRIGDAACGKEIKR